MLFDNVMFSLVLLTHQCWNKLQKDKAQEKCKTCDLKNVCPWGIEGIVIARYIDFKETNGTTF